MRRDGFDLRFDRTLGEEAGMPARRQRQSMSLEQRTERVRLARELAAKLHTLVADRGGVGETGLERNVRSKILENVVGPGKRADGEAHAMGQSG